MAVKFTVLVPYRSKSDKRVWYRYEGLTDGERKEHLEFVRRDTSTEENEQHARDMIAKVREIWFEGELSASEPDDIVDTLIEGSGGVLGQEVVIALLTGSSVQDDEAPFL